MHAPSSRWLLWILAEAALFISPTLAWGQSGRPIGEFDAKKDGDSFPKYFKSFFTDPKRTALITEAGVQLKFLPGAPGGMAGLESDANLAGNFDIEIQYDLSKFPDKIDSGYGASVGLWVKADADVGDAALTRIVTPWAGQQIRLTRAVPQANKIAYGITGINSKALKGRMMMRRVGSEVIALSADTPEGELLEWARFPFTNKPVRLVRLTGDTGGAGVEVEAKIQDLRIRMGGAVPTEPGKPGPQAHLAQPMPQMARKPSPIPTLPNQEAAMAEEKPKTPVIGQVWIPVVVGLACLGVGIAIGRRWPVAAA